jgi:hypothetical protein
MVCFSTHEYRFAWKDRVKWVERLVYFYGAQYSVEHVSFPSTVHPKASTMIRDISMGELEGLLCSTSSEKDSKEDAKKEDEVVVHLGRRWIGSAQAAVFSAIPQSFLDDAKAISAVEQRLKTDKAFADEADATVGTWQIIGGCYENGHELYAHRVFEKPIDLATLHALFRVLLIRQMAPKIEKAFFDSHTKTYHILFRRRIVTLNLNGLDMGSDIDFDLDDGFVSSGSVFREPDWTAWTPHFQAWKSKGSPTTPILPPMQL